MDRVSVSTSRLKNGSNTAQIKDHLIAKINRDGPVSYSCYMEEVLYSEPNGYYTVKSGKNLFTDDYITSPHIHPAFGALIALQLGEMWRTLGFGEFGLVELGAGDGILAKDIGQFVNENMSDFATRLNIAAFDKALHGDESQNVQALDALWSLPPITGCVLSNELLDAMPVCKFTIRDAMPYEIRIGANNGEFVEFTDEQPSEAIAAALADDLHVLPEGYVGEVNLGLDGWIADLTKILQRGYVITIDYGFKRTAQIGKYARGSMRTYGRHVQNRDPFKNIGSQDITADVDFSMLERAFEKHNFKLCGVVSQARFLENLGIAQFIKKIRMSDLPQREKQANIAGLLHLLRLDGVGGFTVYIHCKPAEPTLAAVFNSERELENDFPPPRMNENHIYLQDAI